MAEPIHIGKGGASGGLTLMTLAELIRSSSFVESKNGFRNHSMSSAIAKQFGTIYYNNKVVIYNEQSHILEIRMGIGTKTETAYKGMHSVRMAIYGVEGTIYDSLQDLYLDKTGARAQTDDINKMRKAIEGETSIGDRRQKAIDQEERERKGLPGRRSNLPDEVNKFQMRYSNDDANAMLSGYVIPVASIDNNTGAYTYGTSGKVFYMEQPITVNHFVRVSCSCSDYYFRLGYYNYNRGAHLGQKPADYPGKTAGSETVMNTQKAPGLCKHLMMFAMLLLNGGIIDKAGTKGFDNNMDIIRKRSDKLQVPRKLADESDWGNHLRQLQSSLRNADKRHISQYRDSSARETFNKFEREELNRNSITFNKFMSGERKAARDKYYSNIPTQQFGKDIKDYEKFTGNKVNSVNRLKVKGVLDLFTEN